MPWIYNQSNGALSHDGTLVGIGYSGFGDGENNPAMQDVHDIGPIPQGTWLIGDAVDTTTHGPIVMPLTPVADTETFGRGGFLIHGDSIEHPGLASHGCVVLSHTIREEISASDDRVLEVI